MSVGLYRHCQQGVDYGVGAAKEENKAENGESGNGAAYEFKHCITSLCKRSGCGLGADFIIKVCMEVIDHCVTFVKAVQFNNCLYRLEFV